MTRQDALRLLEATLALEPNTLSGQERLRDLECWDSLSTMEFIAMADKHYGMLLRGSQVACCQTVDELLGLLGPATVGRAA